MLEINQGLWGTVSTWDKPAKQRNNETLFKGI